MNWKISAFPAVIFASIFYIATIAETQIMKKEDLNVRRQSIVAVAVFTAKGDLPKLKAPLNEGLDASLNVNEIKEIILQM